MDMASDAPDDGLWLRSPPELLVGLQGKGQAHKQQQTFFQALAAAGHKVRQQIQGCLYTIAHHMFRRPAKYRRLWKLL